MPSEIEFKSEGLFRHAIEGELRDGLAKNVWAPPPAFPTPPQLDKFAHWAKAIAIYFANNRPTYNIMLIAAADTVVQLYVGMDGLRRALGGAGGQLNDETVCKLADSIGHLVIEGYSQQRAATTILQDFNTHPPKYTVGDGNEPVDYMVSLTSFPKIP